MNPIQDTGPSAALLASVNGAKASAASGAEDAQNRFMKLLVTQMKNQDPLNPLDNAQVTSQLAQLSTVTGIDKVNATLESLMGSFQAGQSLQAAGMIGHGVLAPGSTVSLTDSQGILGVDMASRADALQITIKDANGNQVRQINLAGLDAGVHALPWDGMTDANVAAPDGKYSFSVTATSGGQKTDVTALAFGQVSSVSTGAQGVKLNVFNLGTLGMNDVRQIL